MVKKLNQRLRYIGDISNRHYLARLKPLALAGHRQEVERLLNSKPGMPLKGLQRGKNFPVMKSLDFRQGSGKLISQV